MFGTPELWCASDVEAVAGAIGGGDVPRCSSALPDCVSLVHSRAMKRMRGLADRIGPHETGACSSYPCSIETPAGHCDRLSQLIAKRRKSRGNNYERYLMMGQSADTVAELLAYSHSTPEAPSMVTPKSTAWAGPSNQKVWRTNSPSPGNNRRLV